MDTAEVASKAEPAQPIATKPSRSPKAPSKYQFVDALRGWAILLVILYHTGLHSGPGILKALVAQGSRGVQLFFLVSGFTLLLSHYKRKKDETHPVRNYYIRRAFRIAPAFYLGFLLYTLWEVVLQRPVPTPMANKDAIGVIATFFPFLGAWHWPSIHTRVPGGWSISVETSFYVILPLLFLVMTNFRRAAWFTLGAIVLAEVTEKLLHPVFAGMVGAKDALTYLQLWLPSQLAYFGCGFVFYYWFVDEDRPRLTKQILLAVGIAMAAALVAVAGLFVVYHGGFYHHAVALFKTPFKLSYGLIFLALAMYTAQKKPKWLVNPFMERLGVVSFSCYVLHFGVVWAFEMLIPKPSMFMSLLVIMPLVVAITMGLSYLVYRFIETPGVAAGKRLIESLDKKELRATP